MVDLTQHPELYVRQEIEHLEVFTGLESQNRYSVRTPSGEQLLYAFEESGLLGRNVLSSHRPLTIHVVDRNNTEVINASRSFFWFLSHLHVSDGAGQRIGSMQRRFSISDAQIRPDGRNRQRSRRDAWPHLPALHLHGLPAGTGNRSRNEAMERPRPGGLYRRRHLQGGSGHRPDGSGLLTAHASKRDFDRSRLLRKVAGHGAHQDPPRAKKQPAPTSGRRGHTAQSLAPGVVGIEYIQPRRALGFRSHTLAKGQRCHAAGVSFHSSRSVRHSSNCSRVARPYFVAASTTSGAWNQSRTNW